MSTFVFLIAQQFLLEILDHESHGVNNALNF